MSIAATATFAYLESAPGVFQYTVTLNNTGDTTIGTFWFAWDDAPDQDFMSAQPTNIGDPSGWTDTVTTHLYGSGTGYGIEWRSLSGSDLLAPGGSLDFTFTSTETPAEMAGPSIFDPTFPVTSSFVYITTAFADPGFQFTVTPVCFCRGTLILTDRGEVPVEALAVGDRVKTLSGALKPIRWIGFGRDLVTQANRLARPVIVRAGALANNVPRRDLYLTHGHAIHFDGVLIPVEHLVNHRSILWDNTARVVEYYHLELDDHEVLFAEGAPAESYYDAGNRARFHSERPGSGAGDARPTFAPVLHGGEFVGKVWAALFERTGGRGEQGTTGDPDVHLVVDGERLDPASAAGGVYRFTLAAPPSATLRLCSRSFVPSLSGISRHDHRRLGVAIRQIIVERPGMMTAIDHDAPLLVESGCHRPERGYSWTDGDCRLPARLFAHLMGGFTLIVQISEQGALYPIAAPLAAAAGEDDQTSLPW